MVGSIDQPELFKPVRNKYIQNIEFTPTTCLTATSMSKKRKTPKASLEQ